MNALERLEKRSARYDSQIAREAATVCRALRVAMEFVGGESGAPCELYEENGERYCHTVWGKNAAKWCHACVAQMVAEDITAILEDTE